MSQSIQVYNRLTQSLVTEVVYGEGFLRFVYGNQLGEWALHALVKRAAFSHWYGRRMDAPSSRAKVKPFIDQFEVDVSEFAEPVKSFRTFNEFFYRKLKPSARPIVADPNAIAFPADGRHLVVPDAAQCLDFFVKGARFDMAALVGDAALAERFAQGAVLISRLCPTDYHRFHFPCDGIPDAPRLINGWLYSVSPIALLRRPSILWENKRYVTTLRTARIGDVLLLEVGATCVGSVIHTSSPGAAIRKGDEKGYFRFGGSCFISIFEPGRIQFADDLLANSAAGREVYARMGDVAATIIE
jgi:phosphatidylserine decarboxylase